MLLDKRLKGGSGKNKFFPGLQKQVFGGTLKWEK